MFTYPNKIIAVSCRSLCPRPLEKQVSRIAQAGIKQLILREKDLTEKEYTQLAERVLRACEDSCVELTLHFYPQAARSLGVKRLHMPLDLLTAELCDEFDVTGTSVHSMEQAMLAKSLGADYVTAGHIFATDCKKGLPPRGTEFLESICTALDIPVYAIGGISEENFPQILSAGAAGGCIMSGAMRL